MDPDIARRFEEATTIAQGLSPADAMRDSNDKLSELTRAQWDFDVRRRAFEEAQAFSFTDPVDGAEPVFAEFSPEDAEKVDRFTGKTGLQVDFPQEHGGYFAAVRDPVEDREIGVVPGRMVLALADEVMDADMADSKSGPREPAAEPDDEGWLSRFMSSGQLSDTVLRLLPGIGNVLSAHDAYESWREAIKAARRGGLGCLSRAWRDGLAQHAGRGGRPLQRASRSGWSRSVFDSSRAQRREPGKPWRRTASTGRRSGPTCRIRAPRCGRPSAVCSAG